MHTAALFTALLAFVVLGLLCLLVLFRAKVWEANDPSSEDAFLAMKAEVDHLLSFVDPEVDIESHTLRWKGVGGSGGILQRLVALTFTCWYLHLQVASERVPIARAQMAWGIARKVVVYSTAALVEAFASTITRQALPHHYGLLATRTYINFQLRVANVCRIG